jgi:hypothetical protein
VANNIVTAGSANGAASLWAENPMTLDYDDWDGTLRDFWYNDNNYGSYDSFRDATRQEANGLNISPGFVGTPGTESPFAYQLAPGSLLRGAGADMRKTYHIDPGTRDYYGNLLPLSGPLSMGADEGQIAARRSLQEAE